jgi:hypothetical protein
LTTAVAALIMSREFARQALEAFVLLGLSYDLNQYQ